MVEWTDRSNAFVRTPGSDPEVFTLPDAEVLLYRGFFSMAKSDVYFTTLYREVHWRQEQVTLFGRRMASPRLTAWYGDPGVAYRYSGIALVAQPWVPTLAEIRDCLPEVTGTSFNSVLLNLYRDNRDSVGWHSDDKRSLGHNPVIASVSLGASRRFQLQHEHDKSEHLAIDLDHGSLLIMAGPTQHHWRHQVPKSRSACGPRINLTYRRIG